MILYDRQLLQCFLKEKKSCFLDSGARNFLQHVLCLHQGPQVKETGGVHHGDPRLLHIHHTDFLWVVFTLNLFINCMLGMVKPTSKPCCRNRKEEVVPGWSLDVVEKGHSASKHSPTWIKHGHTVALGLIFNAVWGHCRHEVVVLLKDLHSFNNVCFNNVNQLFCNHSVRGKQDRWFCILCDAFFKLATRFTPKFQVSLRY